MKQKFFKLKKTWSLRRLSVERTRQGFSLIEVLVAVFILTVGITAVSILMVGNIKNLQLAKNQIIASVLAQEGIELVRNLKDNGKLDSAVSFCDYTQEDATPPRECLDLRVDIDPANGKIDDIDNGSDKRLYINNAKKLYSHKNAGATATKFLRKINVSIYGVYVSAASTNRVMTVTSMVSWDDSGVFPTTCNIANKCLAVESTMPDQQN